MQRALWSLFLALAVLAGRPALAAEPKWEPREKETIVILGNTFAERMGLFGYFESYLHAKYLDRQLRVRNLGWSADEITVQPRPFRFGDLDAKLGPPRENIDPKETWFNGLGADALILCFGMTESFRGSAGVDYFRADLDAYLKNHLAHKYNGKNAPRLLLVSPIAHEELGGNLPDGKAHNADLELYTNAMKEVAAANKVPFIDLFHRHLQHLKENPRDRLTFNGIHVTEYGDWLTSQWMARDLGIFDGTLAAGGESPAESLRAAVRRKNDRFWIHFRAVNGEYIYGRRRLVGGVPMIPDEEMLRLMEVDEEADRALWDLAKPQPAQVWSGAPKK